MCVCVCVRCVSVRVRACHACVFVAVRRTVCFRAGAIVRVAVRNGAFIGPIYCHGVKCFHRELGSLKMLLDFFRAYIKCTYMHSDALLMELSARYVAAAKELDLDHVPLLFCVKHGKVSSGHYRTLAQVFEVIVCDYTDSPQARRAVHDMLVWYWASRCTSFNAGFHAKLRKLGLRMRASMSFFETDELRALYHEETKVHVSNLDDVPKVHRAVCHLPSYLENFGPFEDLTTEASEAANKPFKQMFRTYVDCVS